MKKVTCECNIKTNFINLSEILSKKSELLFSIIDEETEIIPSSNIGIDSNINTVINSDINSITNLNTDIELDSNLKVESDINSDIDNEIDSNSVLGVDSNINSDISPSNIIKDCLFLEKISKECKDIVEFEELINEKYIPLNTQETIDKVFELYSEEIKNKKINKTSEIIKGDNVIFQMTTTEEQKNNIKNILYCNISSIDLNECEDILKEKYKINEPLIIIKVDIKRNDTVSTQIEYEVYNPSNLEKLNLSICESAKINIYPPIDLDSNILRLVKHLKEQGYDLFESSDKFYNDICSSFNSFNKTDVLLNDRKNDFYIENITLCEENCEYEEFDIELLKAKCQCNIKTERKDGGKVKFKPNKIIENFYKVEKYANIKVAICYKKVFDLDIFKKNYGSYIIIIIGGIFIFLVIAIFMKLKKNLWINIQKLIKNVNKLTSELKKSEEKEKEKNKHKDLIVQSINKKNKEKRTSIIENKNGENNKNNKINNNKKKVNKIINLENKNQSKFKQINKKKLNSPVKKKNKLFIKNNNEYKDLQSCNEKSVNKKYINKRKNKINIINVKDIFVNSYELNSSLNSENKMKINNKNLKDNDTQVIDKIIKYIPKHERSKFFTDDELNQIEYKYALKIDFRNYFQFYYSLLKQTHLIIFTFFIRNDYNIFLLKIALFLISLALFFFMNALFFNDDSMHKIYEDEGKYHFLYQIPQALYSTIVSQVISSILEQLSLSQDDMLDIKKEGIKKIREKTQKLIKCIKIKCIIFFTIGIILLFIFWYYLTAFCGVYYNTQIPLIKDTCISFLTSILYPFILDLIPGIFRIISLRYKIKFLYIVSNIVTKLIGIL